MVCGSISANILLTMFTRGGSISLKNDRTQHLHDRKRAIKNIFHKKLYSGSQTVQLACDLFILQQ
jgi:hypothetical protein